MASGNSDDVIDLVRGYYRRQYAGFIRGRRINAVPLVAEAWFWRFNAVADDFGNADAEPSLMFNATIGRRVDATPADVAGYYAACLDAGLLQAYTSGQDHFYHVAGFELLQPAGRNGKRMRRCPASPWDLGPAGESGGIQNRPGESSAPIPIPITSTNTSTRDKPAAQASAATADAATTADDTSTIVLTFPVLKKKKTDPGEWHLRQSRIDDLAETFPGVDIRAAARHALQWSKDTPKKRKTAAGMPRFLLGWMEREQNNPRRAGANGHASASRSSDRVDALLESRLRR